MLTFNLFLVVWLTTSSSANLTFVAAAAADATTSSITAPQQEAAVDVIAAPACADCPTAYCWKGTTCLPIQCLKQAAVETFQLATTRTEATTVEEEEDDDDEPIMSVQELHDPTTTEETVGVILLDHLKPLKQFHERIHQCMQLVEDTTNDAATTNATTTTTTNTTTSSNTAVKNLRKKGMEKSDETGGAQPVSRSNIIPYFGVSARLGVYLSRSVQVTAAYNPAEASYGVFAMMCSGVGTTLEASVQPIAGVLLADELDDMVGVWHKLDSDIAVEPMEISTSVAVGIKSTDYSFNPFFQDLGVGGGQSGSTCRRWRVM